MYLRYLHQCYVNLDTQWKLQERKVTKGNIHINSVMPGYHTLTGFKLASFPTKLKWASL